MSNAPMTNAQFGTWSLVIDWSLTLGHWAFFPHGLPQARPQVLPRRPFGRPRDFVRPGLPLVHPDPRAERPPADRRRGLPARPRRTRYGPGLPRGEPLH